MFAGGSAVVPGRWVGGLVQGQNHDRLTRFAFCSVFGLTCWGGKDNNATTALTAFLVHIAILFFVGGNAFSFSSFFLSVKRKRLKRLKRLRAHFSALTPRPLRAIQSDKAVRKCGRPQDAASRPPAPILKQFRTAGPTWSELPVTPENAKRVGR